MTPFTHRPSHLSAAAWLGVGLLVFVLHLGIASLIEWITGRLAAPPVSGSVSFAISWVVLLIWLNRRMHRHTPRVTRTGIEIRHKDTGAVLLDWPDETLAGAELPQAVLQWANLYGLDLCEADLRGADLRDTYLQYSDLSHADLRDADLRDALLQGVDFRNADLRGTRLEGAQLIHAKLTGARCDPRTRWPSGFDPVKQGCLLEERIPSEPQDSEAESSESHTSIPAVTADDGESVVRIAQRHSPSDRR